MGFLDGSGPRPHPEAPEALRARARQDYQANVRMAQDAAVIRGWLWRAVAWPVRSAPQAVVSRACSRGAGAETGVTLIGTVGGSP